jgi:hypothetical protein
MIWNMQDVKMSSYATLMSYARDWEIVGTQSVGLPFADPWAKYTVYGANGSLLVDGNIWSFLE